MITCRRGSRAVPGLATCAIEGIIRGRAGPALQASQPSPLWVSSSSIGACTCSQQTQVSRHLQAALLSTTLLPCIFGRHSQYIDEQKHSAVLQTCLWTRSSHLYVDNGEDPAGSLSQHDDLQGPLLSRLPRIGRQRDLGAAADLPQSRYMVSYAAKYVGKRRQAARTGTWLLAGTGGAHTSTMLCLSNKLHTLSRAYEPSCTLPGNEITSWCGMEGSSQA